MIQIGGIEYSFDDPVVVAAGIAAVAFLLVIVLLVISVRRSGQSASMVAPVAQQIGLLDQRIQGLSDGQHQLRHPFV